MELGSAHCPLYAIIIGVTFSSSKIYLSLLGLGLGVAVLAAILGWYRYQETNEALLAVREQADKLSQEVRDLGLKLEQSLAEGSQVAARLEAEEKKNEQFEDQIVGITNVVGDLEKLSQTDPELLKKYSKVYFLSENYTPAQLADIPADYLYDASRQLKANGEIIDFLTDLLEGATEDDIDLKVVSAYRSFGEQSSLKAQYSVNYGSGANAFSADQGYSEHQLGTTVDFTSTSAPAVFAGFDQTEVYKWLTDNAHKYGFVLSYPDNNQYYQFEPWHWRFVGRKLARDLHRDDKYFYNLDQREIDQYLIDLFD